VGIARRRGKAVRAVLVEDPDVAAGVNDRVQLSEIEGELRRRVVRGHMLGGVSIDDPATVRIDEAVRIGRDVRLGAAVELRGRCEIGEGVVIERGCILTDVALGPGARLGPYVVATWAVVDAGVEVRPFSVLSGVHEKDPARTGETDRVRVGEGARVGPFTHLRQSAVLDRDVHVGNFVELKNTHMEAASKANHLAYLGDADIGARVNVGAGVITCNYDGFGKYRTVVEADAFIGTDSHLVAPLRVGRGAYVGTGTTVTKDVPEEALAIGRARQENKEGYAPRIRSQLQARARALKKG
jgi:bifunctional UDP-N-acetylglucosamine pyrophosphorylase/glucosamine-1-phosphate N-acetyltransferase